MYKEQTMKKLIEYKNEEATAILADLIEPVGKIITDKEIKENLQDNKIQAVKTALKKYGKEIIDLLAIYEGIPREEYNVNPIQIFSKALAIANDKEFMAAFTFSEQIAEN